ncbi:hypothetical protein J6590_097522 [Homalodisca vitripennis]|nr:hypothetical protein J6590_097522 [Homalodisca vitripennis]
MRAASPRSCCLARSLLLSLSYPAPDLDSTCPSCATHINRDGAKNKYLHEKNTALVWPDGVLLNHESKERQPVKRLDWKREIVEQTSEINN